MNDAAPAPAPPASAPPLSAPPVSAPPAPATADPTPPAKLARLSLIYPALRVAFVVLAGFGAWYIAGHWNRWTGAARFEKTDDAYMAGDVTPLASKVSGYVQSVAGRRLPDRPQGRPDRRDRPVRLPGPARPGLGQPRRVAQATLANIANQKDVQRALIRQAQATIEATAADVLRYSLEAQRQHDLLQTRVAGTRQLVEQADANEKRTVAQLQLNKAQLDQQKAVLASLDVQEKQLAAQVSAAEAQVTARAQQSRLHAHRLARPTGSSASARCGRASSSMSARR